MGRLILGVILGVLLVPCAILAWFHFDNPPVAVADHPLPFERQITHTALDARVDHEAPKTAPIDANEQNFDTGAEIYRDQCSACHGFHGKPSSFGRHMYPSAPGLWEKHRNGNVVGVSDDPPGETFWKVSNGIRLTGMPSYRDVLTETQIWQVSLLLANADKPLPPEVVQIVSGQEPAATAPSPAPQKP